VTTLAAFRARLEAILAPIGNRDWTDDALDEALRQARDRYTELVPPRTIETVTLAADGREIDVSSLTYTHIIRVWWDYDDTDPDHPPNWRDFEIWPGDILYISDPQEPETGDVVRLWLEQRAAIEDLDSATSTTVPDEHDTVLLTGAAAYAAASLALERTEQPNLSDWTVRRLNEWSLQRQLEFERRIHQLAIQRGISNSGLAPQPRLDAYDDEWA
jgi:hypothetical protein